MAEKLMIEKSDELLLKFFKDLNGKKRKLIGLMGGWAVHYILKNKDVVHVGSRDIDIFFDPAKIKPAVIGKMLQKLGFHPHSTFRWVKIFHIETEKELNVEESKKHPLHNLSYVFFDIATPQKIKHSMPEPLLKKVLAKENQFIKIKGVKVMVPAPKAIIEMKLKSSINRTDSFKRTKDIADLYALLQNHPELWVIKKGKRIKTKKINKPMIKKFKEKIQRFKTDGTIATTANILNTNQNNVIEVLEKI